MDKVATLMSIDRYQGQLISCSNYHYPLSPPISQPLITLTMAPAKPGGLSDYKAILVGHEREYRESQGDDRQVVIKDIMEEIVAQSKGTLDKDTLKALNKVSQLIQMCNLDIMLTRLRKSKLGMATTRLSHLRMRQLWSELAHCGTIGW